MDTPRTGKACRLACGSCCVHPANGLMTVFPQPPGLLPWPSQQSPAGRGGGVPGCILHLRIATRGMEKGDADKRCMPRVVPPCLAGPCSVATSYSFLSGKRTSAPSVRRAPLAGPLHQLLPSRKKPEKWRSRLHIDDNRPYWRWSKAFQGLIASASAGCNACGFDPFSNKP